MYKNFVIFFLNVFVGIGFGMIYLPCIVIVGFYFEKKRALATGIATCGSGIGTFFFSPLNKFLMDSYGWRNLVFIQAAIILNCAVCGTFFFWPLYCLSFFDLRLLITPLVSSKFLG
jgi:MFS family permease